MESLNLPFKMRIGTDLVYIKRFENKVDDARWIERILTASEKALLDARPSQKRKVEFLAGRYAAKEAYMKACGLGIGPIDFLDIEITADNEGRPVSPLMDVSISHDNDYVIAVVMVHETV